MQEPSPDDSTFQLYKKLSFSYPSLLLPLIHERDTVIVIEQEKDINKLKCC